MLKSRKIGCLIYFICIPLGCYHNGTLYGNESLVPTMEPCLSCQCRDKNLVCSLRVCADQPIPPPRGCVLVQKLNVCCSYVTCSKFHLLNKGHDRRAGGTVSSNTHSSKGERQSDGSIPSKQNSLYRRIENEDDDETEGNEQCKLILNNMNFHFKLLN